MRLGMHRRNCRFCRPHMMNAPMPTTLDAPPSSGTSEPSALGAASQPTAIPTSPDAQPSGCDADQSNCESTGRPLFMLRLANLSAVVIPFAGLIVAIVLLWQVAFNWTYLAILLGMYFATVLGITIGYHRLFTHRSFKTSRPVVAILAALGSMAVEGPLLRWVATHRRHHQHSDQECDPHSPHGHGAGWWRAIRGAWHAHVGWMFVPDIEGLSQYVGDLRKDRLVCWMSEHFFLWVIVGLAIPSVLGGLLTMSWTGVLLGFIWGGPVRVCLVHHMTWSINSICHIWGAKPYKTQDESRNNAIIGVVSLGEGWHNNHHAFPTSARHGLHWWQVDVSYMVIWTMSKVGLAQSIRIPSKDRINAKRKP
jgi:stearoyl-CoA desaturase (delta-9 desaturase)